MRRLKPSDRTNAACPEGGPQTEKIISLAWGKILLMLSMIVLSAPSIHAQNDSYVRKIPHPTFSGYLSDRTSLMIPDDPKDYILDHELQNRLKLSWQPFVWLNTEMQVRNRLSFGESFALNPLLASSVGKDRGLMDLSFTLVHGSRYALSSHFDRAFLELTLGKFELTAGRQRINWSQTFAWNPNDIFNTYSFFDFDYPERPGSDALRLTWFYSATGRIELAAKADSSGKITYAGLFRWNAFNYDFQLLGGILQQNELVLGGGWSGNIGKTGLRGEISFFHPLKDSTGSTDMILSSLAFDFMFYKSWYLVTEILYRWERNPKPEKTLLDYYYAPTTVKDLALSDFSALFQLSMPVSPLFHISFASMGLPGKGLYLGPSFSYSLSNNLEASLIHQIFSGRFSKIPGGEKTRQTFWLNFFRLKWNF